MTDNFYPYSKFDGFSKRFAICRCMNWEQDNFEEELKKLYIDKEFCAIEIADIINNKVDNPSFKITPRSIQRILARIGVSRSIGDAFRLAAKKGRVKWAFKNNKIKRRTLSPKIRRAVFERDNFRCTLCGATAKEDVLETDHIIPICNGGGDELSNLRVLCHTCNVDKRSFENER